MLVVTINWLSVVVAAIAAIVIGAVWYSKLLFGTTWQKAVNLSDKHLRENTASVMVGVTVLAIAISYTLAHIISYVQATTVFDGMLTGFWIWFGFVFTILLTNMLFARRGKKLFMIVAGYWLVALLVMGAILASWG